MSWIGSAFHRRILRTQRNHREYKNNEEHAVGKNEENVSHMEAVNRDRGPILNSVDAHDRQNGGHNQVGKTVAGLALVDHVYDVM